MIILLFAISGITLYAANTGVLEQKVANNDYRAIQLAEAADAGLDYAAAWLASNAPTWIADPSNSNYEIDSNAVSTTLSNGFEANIVFRRATASRDHVTIRSTASETGGGNGSAVSSTVVVQKKFLTAGPEAPIVINGCVSNVTGTPTVQNNSSTYEVVTSQNASCIDQGHFNQLSSPTGFNVDGNAFTGSAWDRTFGVTPAEMQALAGVAGSNVYWITQSTPWHTDLGSLGPPAQPVIAIFTNCAAITGGTSIVGVVYLFGACATNGWGDADIYGSVVVDGNVTSMNANTNLRYDDDYVNGLTNQTVGVKARVPGTWIDQ